MAPVHALRRRWQLEAASVVSVLFPASARKNELTLVLQLVMRLDRVVVGTAAAWLRHSWAALHLERLFPQGIARRGLVAMGFELSAIAAELGKAEALGIRVDGAVNDPGSFPHLVRIHQGLQDIVTLALPDPLLGWAELFLANPPVHLLESLEQALLSAASKSCSTPSLRRLARWALFEAVCLSLVMVDRASGQENLSAAGMDYSDIDRRAAVEVELAIANAATHPAGGATLDEMIRHATLLLVLEAERERTLACDVDRAEQLDRVGRGTAILATLDAIDAILLRAKFSSPTDRLDLEAVRSRHSLVLGHLSSGSLSTRLSRAHERVMRGEGRRSAALVDLARAYLR